MKFKTFLSILLFISMAINGVLLYNSLQIRSLKKDFANAFFSFDSEKGVSPLKKLINFDQLDIKEFIKNTDPKAKTCGAAVSVQARPSISGSPIYDFACLIAGYRSVIWEDVESLTALIEQSSQEIFKTVAEQLTIKNNEAIKKIYQDHDIHQIEGVSYTAKGEREALLMAKKLLSHANNKLAQNSYLEGILLGYAPEDIDFFYQRIAFWEYLKQQAPDNKTASSPPFSLSEWPKELKEQFDSYLQRVWPETKKGKSFFADKEYAQQWLEEQKKYSTEDLLQQIQVLKKGQVT